ncbi:hypothetical protein OU790_12990 [Ruegeria sp. NA]|nr:hypothetical protein [Ruegeria sp. NA]MCX8954351.1 hypothetical protein [Ruegeria sp. NA]
MNEWITILGALGLGSLATVITQWLLTRADSRKKLRFQERKDAYVGLWQAMHRSEIERTEEAALHVGHWVARCELVAPHPVRRAVKTLVDSKPGSPERKASVENVLHVMRKDLGISE